MIRLYDFYCRSCSSVKQDHVVVLEDGEHGFPRHCGKTMTKLATAPHVAYKPHFSHALNRKVNTWKEEEKELAKKGQWIASKDEANRAFEEPVFDEAVVGKSKSEADIKRHVEKVAKQLCADGVISLPD